MNTDTVKQLQKKLGVTADGIFGPLSLAAFDKAINKPVVYTTATAPIKLPILIGLSDYGIKEIPGSVNNPKIVQYFADTGNSWVKDDETAWCAAFVGSCLERAHIVSTKSLAARSYLNWGKPTTTPKVGDIVVFQRDNSATEGHVGFFLRDDGVNIWVFSGNQSNSVDVGTEPKTSVLSYRTY
jgi:uncharacterized protein (TIGR02594 family)